MKKIILIVYGGFVLLSASCWVVMNYSLTTLTILQHSFDIQLWMVSLLVLIGTSLSVWAVLRFNDNKDAIEREARGVQIDDTLILKVSNRFNILLCNKVKFLVIGLGIGSGIIVVSAASLTWEKGAKIYAIILVSVLIVVTFYAYMFFMVIIKCMRDIYYSDFKKYTFIYPIATNIFEEFTHICSFGLILFWTIGLILTVLSIMVFDMDAFFVIAIIGILIFIGYLIFTFYPYYITRKKISALKMQTIRKLCETHDMLDRNIFDVYADIIKYVSESPDVMTSNYQLILTSTLAAIASLITPLFSLVK